MISTELPPILQSCSKIFMLHMNFRSRAAEQGDFPAIPIYHLKPPSTLSVSGADILQPARTEVLLAEGEIALVIGKAAHRVTPEEAWSHVGFVAPANDVTLLDFNWAETPAMVRAKGWDSFTPIGPLVDARTVDPHDLTLRLSVNGEVRQEAHTSDLIFSFEHLVSELSHVMTLLPGDVILTGTPANARPMAPGDDVVVELAGLSTLRNRVVRENGPISPLMPVSRISPRVRAVAQGAVAFRPVALTSAAIASLRSVPIAELCRLLGEAGVAVSPLAGIAHQAGAASIAGYAYTIRQVPSRADAEGLGLAGMRRRTLAALSAAGRDEVIVSEGRLEVADLQSLLARFAERDVAGLVSGGPADSAAATLPVFAAAGREHAARTVPVATNLPIEIAGQLVSPGDLIVGGEGGVIVIPPGAVSQLLERIASRQQGD